MPDANDNRRPARPPNANKWQFLQPPQADGGPQQEPPLIRPPSRGQFRFSLWYIVLGVLALLLFNSLFTRQQAAETVEYSRFKTLVSDGLIKRVRITDVN